MTVYRSIFFVLCVYLSAPINAEVASDVIPSTQVLPSKYPDSWVFALDPGNIGGPAMIGRVMLLDVAAGQKQYKGHFGAALDASFAASESHSEMYVAQTFYSRGTQGIRTDVLTIFDKENLGSIAEVILPGEKRGFAPAQKNTLQLTEDERFALVFNFTPAASVTVVDINKRTVVNEVPIPGCSLIYPTGKRGFSTLCANGALASLSLDQQGQVTEETISNVFNDIDHDPLFMKNTVMGGIAYFTSFLGRIQPIDLSGDKAVIKKDWSLLSKKDSTESWRPSGWQLMASDSINRLYVLMRKNAVDGQHYNGGSEVWIFDVVTQQRVSRMVLKNPGFSIEVTKGEKPYLVVTNETMNIDVYDINQERFLRTIGGWIGVSPMVLYATNK